MIRTVWLAMICLVVVSALAAGKALRAPAEPAVAELPADQATVGIGYAQDTPGQDTLSKADRLEIKYIHHEIRPQPASQPALQPALHSTEPVVPAASPPKPPTETRIISRHWRDPNAFSSPPTNSKQTKPIKQTDRTKKSKNADRKSNQAADRSKPAPVKPCTRPGPFSDLLKSLNLSPACAS